MSTKCCLNDFKSHVRRNPVAYVSYKLTQVGLKLFLELHQFYRISII